MNAPDPLDELVAQATGRMDAYLKWAHDQAMRRVLKANANANAYYKWELHAWWTRKDNEALEEMKNRLT